MVMESRIVSARFLSRRNTLSPRIRLAFAFSGAVCVPDVADAFRFDKRFFLLFPFLVLSFGCFVFLSLSMASMALGTKAEDKGRNSDRGDGIFGAGKIES